MEAKKILVITNDDDVFAKLHFEFDANKYMLQRVSNPLLSVEVLNNNDYYAVVADLSMKEIYMVDMLNNIGFIHTNMPVVLLSSNITADDILLTYEFGFLEILPKDYKKGEVRKLIEEAVVNK
ncbi:MAG: response regulator [Candidatus Mucispirillum faecigallinarum]|uniref:Response regulator n=1 Tax=Candidatus Mucispirillum faecigallinarum TaxID=2838699 RepID=A0A9D2GU99_9BACT|nr:response regulator [Candidatus Mucispirillum faecigallinarum]HIZ88825.1 response regulator [Candidatus Mucispirillum faecigallinarum]